MLTLWAVTIFLRVFQEALQVSTKMLEVNGVLWNLHDFKQNHCFLILKIQTYNALAANVSLINYSFAFQNTQVTVNLIIRAVHDSHQPHYGDSLFL
jgi:hypothetical protein